MLKAWAQLTHDELSSPTRLSYEFENTVQLQPATNGDSAGYIVTIADSVGQTRAAFATLAQTEALVVALVKAAQRVPLLSDAELRQPGTLPVTATIIVLPDGSLDLTTFKVSGTADGQWEIKMLEWMSKEQKWTPPL